MAAMTNSPLEFIGEIYFLNLGIKKLFIPFFKKKIVIILKKCKNMFQTWS